MGRRHIENLLAVGQDVDVVTTGQSGWTSLDPRTRFHGSLESLKEIQPDLVVIANPTSLHAATAIEALDCGAMVLVEKPLCANADEIDLLKGISPDFHLRLAVAYNFRFHEAIVEFRQIIHSGGIGSLLTVRSDVGQYLPDWHPGEDYRRGYAARRNLGGGVIRTLSHEIDYVDWIIGSEPTHVYCVSKRLSELEIDVEDTAALIIDYPSVLAEIHLDMVRRPASRSLIAHGAEGALEWDDQEDRITLRRSGEHDTVLWEGDGSERNKSFRFEAEAALISAERGSFDARFVDPFRTANLMEAAYQSALSGARVEWTT